MNYLAPSILSADFANLGRDIKLVEDAGVEYLHIDVMDGRFVPSISFGMPVLESIRQNSKLFFDVHLMIEEPERYVDEFVKAGADSITVHVETCRHLDRTITMIKDAGIKAAVAYNPTTPVEGLQYILPKIDMVLVMSVNPGFGCQQFIPYVYDKIRTVREMIRESGCDVNLEVDGGVSMKNVREILDAGANVLVSGSGVFKGNISENVRAFQEVFVSCR